MPPHPQTTSGTRHNENAAPRFVDLEHCDGEFLKNLFTVAEGCRRKRECPKEAGAVPVLANALASTRMNLDTRDGRKAAEKP